MNEERTSTIAKMMVRIKKTRGFDEHQNPRCRSKEIRTDVGDCQAAAHGGQE